MAMGQKRPHKVYSDGAKRARDHQSEVERRAKQNDPHQGKRNNPTQG